jgi:hypothetical protein
VSYVNILSEFQDFIFLANRIIFFFKLFKRSIVFLTSCRISINFLKLRVHPHAKMFAHNLSIFVSSLRARQDQESSAQSVEYQKVFGQRG